MSQYTWAELPLTWALGTKVTIVDNKIIKAKVLLKLP